MAQSSVEIDRDFIVADFEFTTYDKPVERPRAFFSEIIEFGAVLIAPPDFTQEQSCQGFVKPQFFPKIAEVSAGFSMISKKDLETGMNFEDMLAELAKWYRPGKTYLTGWGDADWTVLDTACLRYKVNNPFLFTDYLNLAEDYRVYFGHEKTPSLKNALAEQVIEMNGFWHMALNDAANTARLMNKMMLCGWGPEAVKTGKRASDDQK